MPHCLRIRLLLLTLVICCSANWLIGSVSCQQTTSISNDDLTALLKRMEANRAGNERLAAEYTFDEARENKNYNGKGKLTSQHSDKFASVVINGVAYNRVVEEDGKSVAENQQVAEQKRQDAISELRQGYDFVFEMVGLSPHDYIYSDLPISYLDTLFDNRVVGHQAIDGRDNLVVESTPKMHANPATDKARTALDWKETTWIDIEDAMPSQYEVELLRDKDYLSKGGTYKREFTRLTVTHSETSQSPEHAWMLRKWSAQFRCRMLWMTVSSATQTEFYNFKRFRTEVHVLEDSVKPVPAPDASQQP